MQRNIAFKIIYKTINDSSFTNLLMRNELEKVKPINRPFITNLVYGVIKNYDYLNYQHESLYKKINIKNKIILSMAIYEKFFLNEKDYVVNNEYVKLADNEFDKSFINALLHKINVLNEPNEPHIKYSIPKWIYSLLSSQYSNDDLNCILNNYHRTTNIYYHLNPFKDGINDLKKFDIEFIDDKVFKSKESLFGSEEFKKGYFYIQDYNASLLIKQFNFNKEDLFLDACSAPGSKLFNALEYIDLKNAYSNDVNENRLNLIKQKAEILGFNNINYSCVDASKLHEYFKFKFDKILLDVPCSGLGVIGRRSDIKFHIKPENLDELEVIQKNILDSASKIIKDDGQILYSTCTLNKKENDKQIEKFLKTHSDFKLINMETIINLKGDLFFFALLKKV